MSSFFVFVCNLRSSVVNNPSVPSTGRVDHAVGIDGLGFGEGGKLYSFFDMQT